MIELENISLMQIMIEWNEDELSLYLTKIHNNK